ncbi:cell division protein ZipA [Azomonas agilis]|uniref:Cell division protein ZipA n=1 Tax=Azomonas agilis TaxID=116849 RepID=A0A562J2Y1_9GAMM|nr:cell division protein ZipA [Azomonas agilis]TWH77174.1 cell division protein ZipA [Azomonas agilis]
MEIGLREWLILIGIVVILIILFDGWRRMQGGKSKLKLELDQNAHPLPDEPNDAAPPTEVVGPARVVNRPRDRDPLLEDDLPSISTEPRSRSGHLEPDLQESFVLDIPDDPQRPELKTYDEGTSPRRPSQETASKKDLLPIEEVLVINVIARDNPGFRGPALLQNILESGLRFGDMNIFHRHESMTGNGEVLFSMANAVKPGTFDLDDIDHFHTRAVSFFLGLPGPRHPKQAFDLMLSAARKLSQELNGELKDDQRSVLTSQTIEHYRQRIVEFERRQMTLFKKR